MPAYECVRILIARKNGNEFNNLNMFIFIKSERVNDEQCNIAMVIQVENIVKWIILLGRESGSSENGSYDSETKAINVFVLNVR